jgi:FemAB-related protein (PEP-CTERM system-associated)
MSITVQTPVAIRVLSGLELSAALPRLEAFLLRGSEMPWSRHPAWLTILARGLDHVPYALEAVEQEETYGFVPLAYVRSALFGKFLVSLPYVNYGGVAATDGRAAGLLVEGAARLADELGVRYLELRHERALEHALLTQTRTDKAHLRLPLPTSADALWQQLSAKVRNQVRKGEKNGFTVLFGGCDLLRDFYKVFSRNMRDLGTPVYGRRLFRAVLQEFPDRAELCVLRAGRRPVAAALLLHGKGVTEVPSASSLRAYNPSCANMFLYWQLLQRSIERGQATFDFGRSSQDSNTFRFKKQWGAVPFPAVWQYYVRQGEIGGLRTENPRYQRWIRLWQRLPVAVTRLLGPRIVRGIP